MIGDGGDHEGAGARELLLDAPGQGHGVPFRPVEAEEPGPGQPPERVEPEVDPYVRRSGMSLEFTNLFPETGLHPARGRRAAVSPLLHCPNYKGNEP